MEFLLACLMLASAAAYQKVEKFRMPTANVALPAKTASVTTTAATTATATVACEGKGESCTGTCGMAAAAPVEPIPDAPAIVAAIQANLGFEVIP